MDPSTPMEITINGTIHIARDGEQLVPLAHVPITVFTAVSYTHLTLPTILRV